MRVLNILAAIIVLLCSGLIAGKAALAAGLKDVRGYWAAAEIEKAVSIGYVKGYPDGGFRPNAGVNRGPNSWRCWITHIKCQQEIMIPLRM